ncbi:MAG: hypothetical protein KQH59_09245 [Desulfobulbaceae bacterium]|nr:hypothetical protein [Desulfobulbaceae bacterium]
MNPQLSDIERRLDAIQANQAEIMSMLARLTNPAAALSAREKADALLRAERSGDPQQVKAVLLQINSKGR